MMDVQLTVRELLHRAGTSFAGVEVIGEERRTWAETADRARKLGIALHDLGLAKGDRVATLQWATGPHLEAALGIPAAGMVYQPLNARLPAAELARQYDLTGAKALIYEESLADLGADIVCELVGAVPMMSLISIEYDYEGLLDESGDTPLGGFLDERDAAMICFTSGTTGQPRGVTYTHRALCLHALALAASPVGRHMPAPLCPAVQLFHAGGWCYPHLAALLGCKLVLPGRRLDGEALYELLHREGVEVAAMVPTVLHGLVEEIERRGRIVPLRVHTSGATPSVQLEGRAFDAGITVLAGFGMTETQAVTIGSGVDDTLGVPLPFARIGLEEDRDSELYVRSPWTAARYLDEGPDTEDRVWLATGDRGAYRDYGLVVTDRLKDAIKSGGEWISPRALEQAIEEIPIVREAAVVARPDERWGERPVAFVVLERPPGISRVTIVAHLEGRFPSWWLPDLYTFLHEPLPRTSVGKIDKKALRETAAALAGREGIR